MQITNKIFFSFLIFFCLTFGVLFGNISKLNVSKLSLSECLLPIDHPLQSKLKQIFEDLNSDIFESPEHLRAAGFEVLDRVKRGLMVASHPLVDNYLFKKFQNEISHKHQIDNYLKRINGAVALSNFINWNHLQNIVVPKKWLYRLPKKFSDPKTKKTTYILIVEKMHLSSTGAHVNEELAQKYYHIKLDTLKELCFVLYYFRGLDSMMHNMPFTNLNKIAFIDTEKWEIKREEFLRQVMPYLSKDRKKYALNIFKILSEQDP